MTTPAVPAGGPPPRAVVRPRADELATVAVGGAVGSLLRWAATLVVVGPAGHLAVNVLGSLAIGVLMVWTARRGHRLLRPLLGVGLLGGFTTFSGYAVDVVGLARAGDPAAIGWLVATPVLAVAAAAAGAALARRVLGEGPR